MSDPHYYRGKAAEMRRNAQRFRDRFVVREFNRLAEDFDRLAEFTEAKETLTQPRYHHRGDGDAEDADDFQSVMASSARNRR